VCECVSGVSKIGALDRQAEGCCVKELDGWAQQQTGIAWSVGDKQGRLQSVVA
jgi:hypothetical protein